MPKSEIFHSGGSASCGRSSQSLESPDSRTATRADSRIRRRAALNMRNASGSSTISAEATLPQMSDVPASRTTSNHASQHSSVPVTSKQAMTIWRPRQNAQPVAANAANSMRSNPTQAPFQCWVWKERCRVRTSTMIQPTSTAQAMIDARVPRRRPRAR